MTYEPWDIEARFFLGRFASEADALSFVQRVLDVEGEAYADNLELAVGDGGHRNLSGATLAARVRAVAKHDQAVRPGGVSRP